MKNLPQEDINNDEFRTKRKATIYVAALLTLIAIGIYHFLTPTNKGKFKSIETFQKLDSTKSTSPDSFIVEVTRPESISQDSINKGNLINPTIDENLAVKSPIKSKSNTGRKLKIREADDLEEVTAWRRNNFHFVNKDLHTIAKTLEEWYDISIVFNMGCNYYNLTLKETSRRNPVESIFNLLSHQQKKFKYKILQASSSIKKTIVVFE